MSRRNLVAVVTGVATACAVGLAGGITAASAEPQLRAAGEAAVSGKAVFSRGIGAALPNNGKLAVVSVSCPDKSRSVCRGSVALVPRGGTARTLGSRALARISFRLARGTLAGLKLRLNPSARRALSRGPLFLRAVLRKTSSDAVIAMRPVAVANDRPFTAPQAGTEGSPYKCDPHDYRPDASSCVDFSFNWSIPAGNFLVVKSFSCPADRPNVYQGRKLGRGSDGYEGKIEYSASAGTGYAGFNVPTVSEFDFDDNTYYNMQGWPTGGFSFNSIWAPPLAAGSFSLKVTCTDATKFGAANFSKHTFLFDNPPSFFFPWTSKPAATPVPSRVMG